MTITKSRTLDIIDKAPNGGTIVISTPDVDRDKDRVIPTGGRFKDYLKNPVVMYGHQYFDPWQLIGNTLNLSADEKNVRAQFELREALNEHDPQGIVLMQWEQNRLKTASIGFDPSQEEGHIKQNEFGGSDFLVWDLFEWSLVPIPANAHALRLAHKNNDVAYILKNGQANPGEIDNVLSWYGEQRFIIPVVKATIEQLFPQTKQTDFPNDGDDMEVSLRNSQWPQFDRAYAERLKENYPDIWDAGGNVRGDEAYVLWGRAREGDKTDAIIEWIHEREAWVARHANNFELPGVVAGIKWGAILAQDKASTWEDREAYMKRVVDEQKAKIDERENKHKEGDMPNLLKYLKNNNLKSEDVIAILDKQTKGPALAAALQEAIAQIADGEVTTDDVVQMLAQDTGMSVEQIQDKLDGGGGCPTMAELEAIATALDADLQAMVDAAMEDGCTFDEGGEGDEAEDDEMDGMDENEPVRRIAALEARLAEIEAGKAGEGDITKAGRVISQKNQNRLEKAANLITEVLAEVQSGDEKAIKDAGDLSAVDYLVKEFDLSREEITEYLAKNFNLSQEEAETVCNNDELLKEIFDYE